jgi:hypothetical protein
VHAAGRAQLVVQLLAVLGLYAIFASLLLAAVWGTSRATPIAGAGHQASSLRETAVTVLLGGRLAGDRGRHGTGVVGPVRLEGLTAGDVLSIW